MFYELFALHSEENDPRAKYDPETLIITYYLDSYSHESDVIETPTHEWLHGLFDWATEDYSHEQTENEKTDADKDHWIMKKLAFE